MDRRRLPYANSGSASGSSRRPVSCRRTKSPDRTVGLARRRRGNLAVQIDAEDLSRARVGYPEGAQMPSRRLKAPKSACEYSVFAFSLSSIGKSIVAVARVLIASVPSVRDEDSFGCFMFFNFGFATCSLRRTPRPPAELCTPGLISSIPAFSSAETSFIRESTLPRITPSLASMR